MALIFTIGGVVKTTNVLRGTFRLNLGLGSDWTCNFDTFDKSGLSTAYRPAIGDAVLVDDGVTRLFKGIVTAINDIAIGDPSFGTRTRVSAQMASPMDRAMISTTYASGMTLKAVVQDIVTNYLAPYGITLDAGMAAGATLAMQTFDHVSARDVLNHLTDITGWPWRLLSTDVLEMYAAGTKAAPFSLTAANKLAQGPVRWEQSRGQYANRVNLRAGPEQQLEKTDTFTGDGAASTWTTTYTPAPFSGFILSRGYVTEAGIVKTLSAGGGGGDYTFNTATNVLTRAAGAAGVGVSIVFIYTVHFPIVVTVSDAAEIAANGLWETTVDAPDVTDLAAATELANGLLRNLKSASPKNVTVATFQSFAKPGDTITLTFADRTITGSHLITDVDAVDLSSGQVLYTLKCAAGTEIQRSWTDRLRSQIGLTAGGNSGGNTISGAIIPLLSGAFGSDVVANSGVSIQQVRIGNILADSGIRAGAGIFFGTSVDSGRWSIIADAGDAPSYRLSFQDRRINGAYGSSTYVVSIGRAIANDGTYAFMPGSGVTVDLGYDSAGFKFRNLILTTLAKVAAGTHNGSMDSGMATDVVYDTTSAAGQKVAAFFGASQIATTTGALLALEGYALANQTSASGSVAEVRGVTGNIEVANTGAITNARAMLGALNISSSGGGTAWACFFAAPTGRIGGGTGTVTTAHGLYVDTFGSGFTNKYGWYVVDSSAISYTASRLGVGVDLTGLTEGVFSVGGTDSSGQIRGGRVNVSITPGSGNDGTMFQVAGTIVKHSSGTHALFAGLKVNAPSITAGAATLTEASSVYISAAPTLASTNFALHVAAGDVCVGADPGGAKLVRINGGLTISDTILITTKTAFTNGAGAGAGTLGNAPAAGNPTKWVGLDDNGTTRYVPAW